MRSYRLGSQESLIEWLLWCVLIQYVRTYSIHTYNICTVTLFTPQVHTYVCTECAGWQQVQTAVMLC